MIPNFEGEDRMAGRSAERRQPVTRGNGNVFADLGYELAHIIGPGLQEFVSNEPAAARTLVSGMEYQLEHESWAHRFDHYNVSLRSIHEVAEAAIAATIRFAGGRRRCAL